MLPRVVDRIPVAAWAAALVGSAERFSYYAVISIWREHIADHGVWLWALIGNHRKLHAERARIPCSPRCLGTRPVHCDISIQQLLCFLIHHPDAVCRGLRHVAWQIQHFGACLLVGCCWLSVLASNLIADSMLVNSLLICGCATMFATSLPVALEHGAGIPGLAVSMFLIGLGVGGVKSTISPFIGDQYPQKKPRVIRQKNGELAVVDGSRTIQLIYNAFYWYARSVAGEMCWQPQTPADQTGSPTLPLSRQYPPHFSNESLTFGLHTSWPRSHW